MSSKMKMSRRQFAKGTVATAALAATGVLTRMPKVHAADPIELVHWSWLSASDAEQLPSAGEMLIGWAEKITRRGGKKTTCAVQLMTCWGVLPALTGSKGVSEEYNTRAKKH